MAGTISLADILGQAAATNAQQAGYAEQQAGLYSEAAGQQEVIAQNNERAGELASQAKLTELQGQLNTQNARVKAANSLGTNINDVSNIITNLSEDYKANSLQLLQAQADVSDLEANNNLFTNPLGFFKDLLIGDTIRGKRDALAQQVDQEAKTIQNLNALTQATVQTQNAITETLSETSIKNAAELQRISAQNMAAESRTNAAKYGAASVEALAQAGSAAFSRNMQAFNAVQENERMNMARAEHAQRIKATQDADAEIQDTLDNINAYEKQYGRPLTSKLMLKKYFGSQGELGNYLRVADLGGFKLRQGSNIGVLGTTPADAYFTAKAFNLTLPDSYKPSGEILSQAFNTLETARQAAQANPMGVDQATGLSKKDFEKPETTKAAFNKIVSGLAAGYQARIESGKGNPYEALPISSVLQSPAPDAQALAASKFAKTVLSNLQVANMEQPSPQMLMQTALSSVNNGDITLNEARDGITAYYQASVGLNNAVGGFAALNVPGMNSYNVKADDIVGGPTSKIATGPISMAAQTVSATFNPFAAGGLFSSTVLVPQIKFDLTKPQDVTTALTILNSSKMRDRILNNVGAETQ